jgi:hypothetical protein
MSARNAARSARARNSADERNATAMVLRRPRVAATKPARNRFRRQLKTEYLSSPRVVIDFVTSAQDHHVDAGNCRGPRMIERPEASVGAARRRTSLSIRRVDAVQVELAAARRRQAAPGPAPAFAWYERLNLGRRETRS